MILVVIVLKEQLQSGHINYVHDGLHSLFMSTM